MGSKVPQTLCDQSYDCELCLFGDDEIIPRWLAVKCQLKIPKLQPLRCCIPAFVAENRFLEVGTKWLFEQVMQSLIKRSRGHCFRLCRIARECESQNVAGLGT